MRRARRAGGEIDGVSATVGDARSLDAADDSFDVVLLLGPLYHLVEASDRAAALREAARVARPGALVAAAAIGRYAGLLDLGAHAGLDETTEPIVAGDPRDRPPRSAARLHHRLPAPARGAARRARRRGPDRRRGLRRGRPRGPGAGRPRHRPHRRVPARRRCAARGSRSATRRCSPPAPTCSGSPRRRERSSAAHKADVGLDLRLSQKLGNP